MKTFLTYCFNLAFFAVINTMISVEASPAGSRGLANSQHTTKEDFHETELTLVNSETLSKDNVYPFTDEGKLIFKEYLSFQNGPHTSLSGHPLFNSLIDLFGGAGHTSIPIIKVGKINDATLLDIDKNALSFAEHNLQLNGIKSENIKTREYNIKDKNHGLIPEAHRLFVANPPFALRLPDTSLDRVRDGGEDGLALTRHAVETFYQLAKENCILHGLAYSRIKLDPDSSIINSDLKHLLDGVQEKLPSYDVTIDIKLLDGEKLWRGTNGKKEQPNPMPLSAEYFNAKAKSENDKVAYKNAEAHFIKEGKYSHLGYFVYTICVRPKR